MPDSLHHASFGAFAPLMIAEGLLEFHRISGIALQTHGASDSFQQRCIASQRPATIHGQKQDL